jgi:hypothetical protein
MLQIGGPMSEALLVKCVGPDLFSCRMLGRDPPETSATTSGRIFVARPSVRYEVPKSFFRSRVPSFKPQQGPEFRDSHNLRSLACIYASIALTMI